MGGRLSRPRSADRLSEGPQLSSPSSTKSQTERLMNRRINPRTVVAPLAALTMAGLLFVYARTSIQAAKRNAQRHREADGGQISWHNESMRRHGQRERLDNDRATFGEALKDDFRKFRGGKGETTGVEATNKQDGRSEEEARLRKLMGKKD